MPNIPNFLVIGAAKSGTTSLTYYLSKHPEIFVPDVREPSFFAYEGQKNPNLITSWDQYLAIFEGVTIEKCIGETSPVYLFSKDAPDRIHHYIPQVKLIAVLRHPADRLYSRFMQLVKQNKNPTASFEEALIRGNVWWQRLDLIQEGFYYTHLKRYFEKFARENIKVFLYEELDQNPSWLLRDLFCFLQVDQAFVPDISTRLHRGGKVRSTLVEGLVGQDSITKKLLKTQFPALFQTMRSNMTFVRLLNELRRINLRKPSVRSDTRARLIDEVYRDEILKVQDLLERDLSHWLDMNVSVAGGD